MAHRTNRLPGEYKNKAEWHEHISPGIFYIAPTSKQSINAEWRRIFRRLIKVLNGIKDQ